MNKIGAAALAASTVSAALTAGARHGPRRPRTAAWYLSLRKPSFTPPGPAIGAAWTVLGALLAISGYRLMAAPHRPERTWALGAWALTVGGIVGYPWMFFTRKQLGASSLVAAGMAASAATAVGTSRRVDPVAALAGLPLVAWVGFATLLSEELWRRNDR